MFGEVRLSVRMLSGIGADDAPFSQEVGQYGEIVLSENQVRGMGRPPIATSPVRITSRNNYGGMRILSSRSSEGFAEFGVCSACDRACINHDKVGFNHGEETVWPGFIFRFQHRGAGLGEARP
jgi:hypothetical protein